LAWLRFILEAPRAVSWIEQRLGNRKERVNAIEAPRISKTVAGYRLHT
jgi:hypothetical protein